MRDRHIEDGMGFAGLVGENCRDCVSYQKELARKNRRIAELEAERDALKANCSQFVSDGYVVCGALGSEDCDWCPFHDEIGQRVEVSQDEQ